MADGEGLGGVSLFRQVVRGDVLFACGVDWGEAEGQELDFLVPDARVDDEDQGHGISSLWLRAMSKFGVLSRMYLHLFSAQLAADASPLVGA